MQVVGWQYLCRDEGTRICGLRLIGLSARLGSNRTDTRRDPRIRAYGDEGLQTSQTNVDTRLIVCSVWNTQRVLIIPGETLLAAARGRRRFIHGQPVPASPGTRDGDGIKDIKRFYQTYSHAGL